MADSQTATERPVRSGQHPGPVVGLRGAGPDLPRLGEDVLFALNDDLALSPAKVIATAEATDPQLLARDQPRQTDGRLIGVPSSPWHVHLVVFGLVNTYRVYDVPFAHDVTPGRWSRPS